MTDIKRARYTIIAAALVIALAVALLLLRTRGERAPVSTDDVASAGPAEVATAFIPPPPRPLRPLTPAEPPVIDEVVLDKTSACEGEEVLVTIRAHAPDPADDIHLHGMVDGVPGMSVPVVARKDRGPESPPPAVAVFGRDGKRALAEIPPFEVEDCKAAYAVDLRYQLYVNTNAQYEFTAALRPLGARAPFEAVEYVWDFGDGTVEKTAEPRITHDFGAREQDTMYADYLVQVRARSASGDEVLGRRAMLIRNPAFSNLVNAGVVTLVVELTPRFPTVEDGVVRQGFRLWHHRPGPIEVKQLRKRSNYAADAVPVITPVSIAGTLGTTTIPPSGITFEVALEVDEEPDLRSVDFLLDGVSADGYPVKSVFSVMKPSPRPTPEAHDPVTDPVLRAKIMRARELLGKDYVTDEDLFRLQREGKFDDLPGAAAGMSAESIEQLPPVYEGRAP